MLGTTRNSWIPALAVVAIAGAGLVRPTTAQAQATPEQGLLNRAPVSNFSYGIRVAPSPSADEAVSQIAGEQALLGRTESPSADAPDVPQVVIPINGERALLSRTGS